MNTIPSSSRGVSRAAATLLAALSLGAAGLAAQASPSSPVPVPRSETSVVTPAKVAATLERSDLAFLGDAAKGNQKELRLSQLGVERASNERVKEYAEQLVGDHHGMQEKMQQLAQRKGMSLEQLGEHARSDGTPPASATAREHASPNSAVVQGKGVGKKDSRAVQQLMQESGRDFDQRFVSLMVKEHEEAVKLFERAASEAQDQDVRQFAAQHVTALREHLQEARDLQRVVAE